MLLLLFNRPCFLLNMPVSVLLQQRHMLIRTATSAAVRRKPTALTRPPVLVCSDRDMPKHEEEEEEEELHPIVISSAAMKESM